VTAPQSAETQTTEPAQPVEPPQKAEPAQQAQQAETAPVPPGAPRTPPQMREVTAANIAPGTAQPIEPSNIVVPRENPEAPQLEPVTVPPASADQTETVYIGGSGTTEGSGTPSQTSAQTNFRSLPPSGSVSAEVPGTRPLSAYSGGAKNSYQLASIQFADGSSRLSDRDRDVLRGVVDQAKRAGGTLRIIGHASSRTEAKNVARHREANARISAERAAAVARELIRLGMPASSMYVGAVSDADPRYFEFMPTGEAGNRRAEIFIDF
jgi:outer membrane protein OmpA-like peptidoglycan-associated protein